MSLMLAACPCWGFAAIGADPVGGVVLGVLGAARGLAHLPILLGALMLLRLSPLSLQMAPANQIKTKLN